ncbi:MAG: hypothetical protein AMXMBFR82_49120 [Candidatus Hydrogenedentota bacterium]
MWGLPNDTGSVVMLALLKNRVWLRIVTVFTIATFLPSAAGAWNFFPAKLDAEEASAPENPWADLPWVTAEQSAAADFSLLPWESTGEGASLDGFHSPLKLANLDTPSGSPGDSTEMAKSSSQDSGNSLEAQGYRPVQLAKATGGLPNASELLANLAAMSEKKDEPKNEPVVLAQAEPAAPEPLPAPGTLAYQVAEAKASFDNGEYVSAGLSFLSLANQYSSAEAIAEADDGVSSIMQGTLDGTIPFSVMDAFTAQLPPWESLSTEARYILVSAYNNGVESAIEKNNPAGVTYYIPQGLAVASAFCHENGDSYFIQSAVDYYHDTATAAGPEQVALLIAEFEDIASVHNPEESSLAGPLHKIAVLDVLDRHFAEVEHNFQRSPYYCAMIEGAAASSEFQAVFDNKDVQPWVKAFYAFVVGRALWRLHKYEEAYAMYNQGIAYGPDRGSTRQALEFYATQVYSIIMGDDEYAGILAFNDFLTAYPNADYKDRALLQMGGLYLRAGDWASALEFFRQVIAEFPEGQVAKVCQGEIDYIMNNLYGTVQVAKTRSDASVTDAVRTAQLCGPYALRELLAARNIDASVEQLAQVAGSDEDGTSMLGLIEAANGYNVQLSGVQYASVDTLQVPCLAFVNGNHFVYVESVDTDWIKYRDIQLGSGRMATRRFASIWNGEALVTDAPIQTATLLTSESLSMLVGGCDDGGGDTTEIEESDYEEDCPTQNAHTVGRSGGGSASGCGGCGANTPCSPAARISTNSPGVNVMIDGFQSRMVITENDLSLDCPGPLRLFFERIYTNPVGYQKEYSELGDGWTHTYSQENGFYQAAAWSHAFITTTLETRYFDVENIHTNLHVSLPRGGHYSRSTSAPEFLDGNCAVEHPDPYIYERNGVTYQYEPTATYTDAFGDCGDIFHALTVSTQYRLASIHSASAGALSMSYDGSGRVTMVTAPGSAGQVLHITYAGDRISQASLSVDSTPIAVVEYEYNANGELTKVLDINDNAVTYEYGSDTNAPGSRFITKITDRMGTETYFDYEFGQDYEQNWEATKITVTDEAGLTAVYDRSITTDVATITVQDRSTVLRKIVNTPVTGNLNLSRYMDYYIDSTNCERWEYEYDLGYRLTKVLTPADDVWQEYEYDSTLYDRLTKARRGTGPWTYFGYADDFTRYANSITGPDGTVTNIHYDANGRISKVTHPSVGAYGTQYAYDSFGDVTRVTDPSGRFTDYAYDSAGNLTAVSDPNSNVTTFSYDDFGNVTSVTDPRSKTTEYEYATGGCSGCGGSFGLLTKVIDPLDEETTMAYDTNGNLTKVTDALGVVTDYFYDAMNRLTKVQTPAPSGPYMTLAYDKQGQVVSRTDFEGVTTTYEYDHRQRLTKSTDPIDDVTVAYASDGLLDSVTDGLSHSTVYDYDGAFRLTSITDAASKVVKYFYDTSGRMTKVGAGSTGTFDPTEYFFDATTGLMTKVRYTSDTSTFDANYFYDSLARVTKITDWIDGTNGLRYGYDDAGRLTSITDYDNSTLTYAYDAAGNVTSMTDYHGNTTTYTYTDRNELSTLTAPGSKTWTFHYNDIGQPTYYDIPNGMTTNYGYDSRNRLTTIEHKDGTTVLDGFAYALDDVGNITSTTHEDGSFWDYEYDGRYRLTSAVRKNSNETIEATYAYTYDAGDNLLTKVEPFEDDFNDGNYTGWSAWSGTWSAANNYLRMTPGSAATIAKANTDNDNELRFSYVCNDTSNAGYTLTVSPRYASSGDRIYLEIKPGSINLSQRVSGVWSSLDTSATSSTQGTEYAIRVVCDGQNVTVYRAAPGALEEEILSTSSCTVASTNNVSFTPSANADYSIDNIRVLSNDLSNTTTFAVNNANELTSMTDYNGSTTFGFDAWGRMTSKARGSYAATYGYRYGQMLRSLTSDFPGEGNVTYEYGANHRQRQSTIGAASEYYNWTANHVVNVENGSGGLQRTSIGGTLAVVTGASAASGSYEYHMHDVILSDVSAFDADKQRTARHEYEPYGDSYSNILLSSGMTFATHAWRTSAETYFGVFRQYSPSLGRWLSRDPLGFVDGFNLYSYVMANPVSRVDLWGLDIWTEGPSGNEPSGHMSVCVGDPNGFYQSFSFGLNIGLWPPPPAGVAYPDLDLGGDIYKYLPTTDEQDIEATQILLQDLDDYWNLYGPENCRTYSDRKWTSFRLKYQDSTTPTDPPIRMGPTPDRPWWRRMFDWFSTTFSSTEVNSLFGGG